MDCLKFMYLKEILKIIKITLLVVGKECDCENYQEKTEA